LLLENQKSNPMNVKKLFVNTLLMGAVATAPVGLSSCDDDDGGGGPSEPDVAEGEATATLTGDAETTIVPDGPINVSTTSQGGQDVTNITWTDTALNSVTVNFFAIGETGTYNAAQQGGEGFVTVTLDGTQWTSGGGEIGVATNNDTRIAGTLNDVSLSPQGGGSGSVTLNGEFNALKNGGGGTTNQITLSGAAEDTLSFDLAVPASLDAPVVHKRVTLGAEDVVLRIVPQDGTGSISAIADTAVTSDNPPSEGVAVVVNYDGSEWGSTGEGSVNVGTNDSTTVEGTLNDVVVGTEGVDENVTLNGSFSASE
jgi:hypothetical protein